MKTDSFDPICEGDAMPFRTAPALGIAHEENPAVTDPISIKEARERYADKGYDSVYPGYRDVIEALVRDGYAGEFRNDSYADALFLTDIMFSQANKSVRMLTGGGGDGFIETLSARFEEMLKRLEKNAGEVRIIMLSSVVPSFLRGLAERFSGTLKVARAKSAVELKHFIVCDRHMSRIEAWHKDLTDDTPASEITAKVTFNDPMRAEVLEKSFDSIWERVAPRQ